MSVLKGKCSRNTELELTLIEPPRQAFHLAQGTEQSFSFADSISTLSSISSLFCSASSSTTQDGTVARKPSEVKLHLLTRSCSGRQTPRAATARGAASPLCRNRARRHHQVRVDIQHPARQLCELHWTSAAAELYGYWYGRV